MLMSPLMVSLGAMIAFFTVVTMVVWLPYNTFKVSYSTNWLPLSDKALSGRALFLQNGCPYCHSGFVRPQDVQSAQYYLYPRVSDSGDYYGDWEQSPNLLGTERSGPDLSMESGWHPDDWQYAHYFNPRNTEPDSLMPMFSYLTNQQVEDLTYFDQTRGGKDGLIRYAGQLVAKKYELQTQGIPAPPVGYQAVGNAKYLRDYDDLAGAYNPPIEPNSNLNQADAFSLLNHDPGYWLEPDPLRVTRENLVRGRQIYEYKCSGCHGVNADGKGPAYPFLSPQPIDFTGKDDACCGIDTSPGDLYYRILVGVPGTAMHNFGTMLSVDDIWRVVLFLKTIPNGGLDKTKVPSPQMFIRWSPNDDLKTYLKKYYNILKEPQFVDPTTTTNPFIAAAQSILPSLPRDGSIAVYVKASKTASWHKLTIPILAAEIKAEYDRMANQAYNDAVKRGEHNLPPRSFIDKFDAQTVMDAPPSYDAVLFHRPHPKFTDNESFIYNLSASD
jgi:cbb3-type cytochrome c oxidase subunit II